MQSIPLKFIRKTAAEILAFAMCELFPEVKLIGGKATDLGFYYDFSLTQPLTEDMLILIEERMRGVTKEALVIETLDMMRENAMEMFRHQDQPYKVSELENCTDNIVQILKIGKFHDVGSVPFAEDSSFAEAFKLQKVQRKTITLPFYDRSGQKKYEKHQAIRIIGTASSDKQALKAFLKQLKAAKDLTHEVLGVDMELFTVEKDVFPEGFFWLPKGKFLQDALLNFLKDENQKSKIQSVSTPNMIKQDFLKKSFDETSSFPLEIEGDDYLLTSQKSALHALLYQSQTRHVEDLPIRYSEISEGYFTGDSSELDGLFRTRTFLTDNTHIFCSADEVVAELISCLQLIDKTAKILGFEYIYVLNARKPKGAKTITSWKQSIEWLEKALNESGFQFVVDKEDINHYINQNKALNACGPTIEVEVTDTLGRKWKSSSLGLDLSTRESFGLQFVDQEGRKQAPQMISRSIFRSLEQFIALLIERNGGLFPLWLADTEVAVLPIAIRNIKYAKNIENRLIQAGVRVSIDEGSNKLGEKIHRAEKKKVLYMLIVGDNEEKGGTVTVRACMQDKDRAGVELDSFLKQIADLKSVIYHRK